MSRNTNGMLKTLTSGTIGPSGPSETRAIWIAPTWVCSIIDFSSPSTLPGNIWNVMRPLVAVVEPLAHVLDRHHGGVARRVHVGGLEDHLVLCLNGPWDGERGGQRQQRRGRRAMFMICLLGVDGVAVAVRETRHQSNGPVRTNTPPW